MRLFIWFTLLLLLFINNLPGQSDATEGNQSGNLYLGLRSISFVKNKEYSNPEVKGLGFLGYMYKPYQLVYSPGYGYIKPNIEGYTLIGNFIEPSLIYFPYSKLSIRVGAQILNYSGAGKLSGIKPVLSTKISFSEKTSLTLGSLEGSEKHRLSDPVFDTERTYSHNSENGIELLTENNHFFNDTWLDWENFIFKGDTDREILTFGESFKYTSDKIQNLFDLNIPVQLLIKHKGGQISNYSEPLETYINIASGMSINFDINKATLGRLGFDYLHFYYYDNSPDRILSFNRGYSNWYKLHYNYKIAWFEVAYWNSHNFYAPNGNLIYSSISGYQDKTILPDRSLLTASMYLTVHPVRSFELFFGLDFYYDLNFKVLYSAAALHLSFNEMTKLFSIKNN
jgi:hypothetical protein